MRHRSHPGEILRKEYLEPLGISANRLAISLRVPANRITAILRGECAVSANTALRLARLFDTTPEFWMNLQQAFDLRSAEIAHGEGIRKKVKRMEHSRCRTPKEYT